MHSLIQGRNKRVQQRNIYSLKLCKESQPHEGEGTLQDAYTPNYQSHGK